MLHLRLTLVLPTFALLTLQLRNLLELALLFGSPLALLSLRPALVLLYRVQRHAGRVKDTNGLGTCEEYGGNAAHNAEVAGLTRSEFGGAKSLERSFSLISFIVVVKAPEIVGLAE
ncbi:hypothetical protein BOTBODRAFT_181817 [Botryobasidium botryosum FD-172 SS1]|uniref:Uncharacterized protein n=1 Tax=Botryobasidium botryosum (strain FD-172 SS1) TaxID=930990 RepID=A0A067LSZ1_BOTB1|nr:hypothetical protein BOTBODRAFT_181817 [Botryobasidium botryosum FD-172 SS1]